MTAVSLAQGSQSALGVGAPGGRSAQRGYFTTMVIVMPPTQASLLETMSSSGTLGHSPRIRGLSFRESRGTECRVHCCVQTQDPPKQPAARPLSPLVL